MGLDSNKYVDMEALKLSLLTFLNMSYAGKWSEKKRSLNLTGVIRKKREGWRERGREENNKRSVYESLQRK